MGAAAGYFAWYANILLLIAHVTVLLRWWWPTVLLSGLALIIGATTFAMLHDVLPVPGTHPREQVGAAGQISPTVLGFGAGVYVWLASIAALGAGRSCCGSMAGCSQSHPCPCASDGSRCWTNRSCFA